MSPDPHRNDPSDPRTEGDHVDEADTPQTRRLADALDQVATNRPVGSGWERVIERVTDGEAVGVGATPPDAVGGGATSRVDVESIDRRGRSGRPRLAYLVGTAAAVLALIAAAVFVTTRDGDDDTAQVAAGPEPTTEPARGGTVRYGVPELPPAGLCLPEVRLGGHGELIAGAVYDPLVARNADGTVSPYLATSMEPDASHTTWEIHLRPGVRFHDGSALDAQIVKDNLDAHRGWYEGRASTLHMFMLDDIATVDVVDDLTVRVTTKQPWAELPSTLASPSFGIMARTQLDASPEECAVRPIGTGPFMTDDAGTDDGVVEATRNAGYWRIAPDGEPYPYADAVEFRTGAVPSDLEEGTLDYLRTDAASLIAGQLTAMHADGTVELTITRESAQTEFVMLNTGAAPFDDPRMRRALALAIDPATAAATADLGEVVVADGPFGPSVPGHLDDVAFPRADVDAARALVDEYVASGGSAAFGLVVLEGTDEEQIGAALQEQAAEAGMELTVRTVPWPDKMPVYIAKDYQAGLHRFDPAGGADQLSMWWWGDGNPTNFNGFDDPVLDDLLATGRTSADPAARTEAYEAVTRHFAEQVYDVWLWHQPWAVAARPGTGAVFGPELPDGSTPVEDLSFPHSLLTVTPPN